MEETQKVVTAKEKKGIGRRVIIVLLFVLVLLICTYIGVRTNYLEILEIGTQYIEVFNQNIKNKAIIIAVNFVILFLAIYITTKFIKKGLKKFFDEEKKEMPKLPNKSIALIISAIVSILMANYITEKVMFIFNSTFFGITDPVFNMDIAYYMFQKPFIEFILFYLIAIFIGLTIYTAVYYIAVFNTCFDGIDIQTLKNNTFVKQIIVNIVIISILIGGLTIIKSQDIVFGSFLTLNDENNTAITGAGFTDVTVKLWGYRIFGLIIPICVCMAAVYFKQGKRRKLITSLLTIPAYLVLLFFIIIIYQFIFVNSAELDRQQQYISNNIESTKRAFNINIEEKQIENSGTITTADVENNKEVLDNVVIIDKNITLDTLQEYQNNVGYYAYSNTKVANYKIDNKDTLVYLTPREIRTNIPTSFASKTYEYTHGYSAIVTSAVETDASGNIKYIQSDFQGKQNKINITQPRIYFGLETNDTIITKSKSRQEFDYPITTTQGENNEYDGNAGLTINAFDKFILGLAERNVNLAFGIDMTENSKILLNRNIIKRAEKIIPYLTYDQNPYLVVTDEGRLVWILDAYTTSNKYPYSTSILIEENGLKKEINYIRNSVKVLIDAYDGTVDFYITDKSDPIAMAYNKMYPNVFHIDETIPQDIAKHIVYSEFLYSIQAEVLTKYHNVQPEVLYRSDDIWEITKYSSSNTSITKSTEMEPYYTMVKDGDRNTLGLVIPYSPMDKKNIISYLVGTYDENNNSKLVLYKFTDSVNVIGPTQLDTQIQEDETITSELESISVTGTKIIKNMFIIPIEDTLLYVEPVYQVLINETNIPVLKKVIVASGNKVAIGNNFEQALDNLLSQYAVNIEFENTEDIDGLIEAIIKANNNLNESNLSNNWELIGKDLQRLQELIEQLEVLKEQEEQNEVDNEIVSNEVNIENITSTVTS